MSIVLSFTAFGLPHLGPYNPRVVNESRLPLGRGRHSGAFHWLGEFQLDAYDAVIEKVTQSSKNPLKHNFLGL